MAESNTKQATQEANQVKLDMNQLSVELATRYRNALGWNATMAENVAEMTIDVLTSAFGGSQQYFPKRSINRDKIIEARTNGMRVEEISRKFAISTRTVLNYTNK